MSRQKCLNKYENEKDCPCEYMNCRRHGVCCECVAYHRKNGDFPACLR